MNTASGNPGHDTNGISVVFQLNEGSKLNKWGLADYRGPGDTRQFTISTEIESRSYKSKIKDNFIGDFDMTIMHESVGKLDITPEDFWGYEVEEQNPNEIMYALIAH